MTEIVQLLEKYDGKAIRFKGVNEYLNYLSDIDEPKLPWEDLSKLREVAESLAHVIKEFVESEHLSLLADQGRLIETETGGLQKVELEELTSSLRALNLDLRVKFRSSQLRNSVGKLDKIVTLLRDPRALRGVEPEQFEKLVADVFKIIDDEILIKPNYPTDDEGEPISHSPGNKSDVECFYETFGATCEVTLNASGLQWVQEGQPVMRHLRNFESGNEKGDVFCIFVAPRIHVDTYSTFWNSVRHGYDGKPQKIVPLTVEQFADVLEFFIVLMRDGKTISHEQLLQLYSDIVTRSSSLRGFSEWADSISRAIEEWKVQLQP